MSWVDTSPCRASEEHDLRRAERRRPKDARAYIRPLAEHQVLRLPRKTYRQSGGDQGTPGRTSDPLQSSKCCACHAKATGDQGTPGRTSDPLQNTKCGACHAKATETKGHQGVHPTPCRAPSAAPATQNLPAKPPRPRDTRAYIRPLAEHQVLRLPRITYRQSGADERGRPRDARAYIRPLAEQQVLRLPRKKQRTKGARAYIRRLAEHQVRRLPRITYRQSGADERGRPRDARAYIRPLAEQQVLRLPRKKQRRPRDARAYIRPLAEHQVLRLPRKTYRQSGGDQGTPGRTSDPLQSSKCCACLAKATGRAAETKGRQGVHPTPCRAASAALATQKQRRPRDARAHIRPLPSAAPAKWVRVSEGEWVSVSEWM